MSKGRSCGITNEAWARAAKKSSTETIRPPVAAAEDESNPKTNLDNKEINPNTF